MAVIRWNEESREVPAGTVLSRVLAPGHLLETACGGRGRCGKCRVTVQGQVSPPSPEERTLLSPEELARGVRLACCARAEGDCTLELGTSGNSQIQLAGEMAPFSLAPVFSSYGAALDVGTTTLAAALYSRDGRRLAQASAPNPQSSWGADVISRVEAAQKGEGPQLAAVLRKALGDLLRRLAAQAGIPVKSIDGIGITGNTVMLTLLVQGEVEGFSHAPFQVSRLFGERLEAGTLGLPCSQAHVLLPPCVSAFVGADIVTALLASGIPGKPGVRMMVDIGTNGEIVLSRDGTLLCCSTAAGPAFEGAGLSWGMAGKDGAVDHLWWEDSRLQVHVLGEAAPRGICGSGVVDALACLLERGVLDETGCLEEDPAELVPPVSLSQKDVRMVQLAKAAVCAGLETLLCREGIPLDAVQELAVAGGFGSYLNVASAGRIGLLPPELTDRVRILGNAALSGAAMLLLGEGLWEGAIRLARSARPVELSASPVFQERYVERMLFPESP